MRRACAFLTACVIALVAVPALADESAEDLKARGNQAMVRLDYSAAVEAYRGALTKNPNDAVLFYNLGRALQARDDFPAALDAFREFDRKASPETKSKVPGLATLIEEIRGRVAELSVRCSVDVPKALIVVPLAAKVEGCGPTPKRIRTSVRPDTKNLEVRLESDEYQAASITVAVRGGGPVVDIELEPRLKATSGVLRVRTTPASASVSLDGKLKGNAPVEVLVPEGSHGVDVDADGYERAHVPFVIKAGDRKDLDVTLEKTTPLTKRWWFWTAAGVLVAGAVTAGAILIIQPERDAREGSIPPGIIQAPLVGF